MTKTLMIKAAELAGFWLAFGLVAGTTFGLFH